LVDTKDIVGRPIKLFPMLDGLIMNLPLSHNFTARPVFWLCLAVAITLSIDGRSDLFADEVDIFDDAMSLKIVELSESGNCADAWNIIWPHVLRGSNRATAQLAGEMSWGNIHPPVASPTPENWKNDEYMRFAADLTFQIDPEKTTSAKDAYEFKKSVLSEIWDKKVFAAYEASGCLKQGAQAVCFDPDSWSGMVSTLSEWRQTFDSNETLGLIARCRKEK
jgi:hypothetical protein